MINICFHGVGEPARELEPGEDKYWISHQMFLQLLDLVAERSDVALSFDDGNTSDVEVGLPALTARGLSASFFVLAGRLGKPGSLTVDGVAALSRSGMTVGTHGMDHRPWRRLDPTAVRRELVEAREVIARAAGRPVTDAACPLGRYDRKLLRELRRLGYERVYTSDRAQANATGWLQARHSVTSQDTSQTVSHRMLSAPTLQERLRTEAVGMLKRLR